MKLILKTLGWAVISGTIFVLGAVWKECPWEAAIAGAVVATLFKTPAYPLWEVAFNWMYPTKKKEPVTCKCCCKCAKA